MSKSPLISVIVPAYNEEAFISTCLKSLTRQNFSRPDYEIIVVDNASTDQTSSIARKYPARLIKEHRKSVVLARQTGYAASHGQIIVTADADTLYPPYWLKRIYDSFTHHPEIIALVGWLYYSDTPRWFNYLNSLIQNLNLFLFKLTGRFPIVFAANFAFRRQALEHIGGYPTHLPELGDQQYLLFRFQELGPVMINPRVFCHTSSRRHQGQLSKIIFYNGWYRLLGYFINRLLGRQIIGPAPAIRITPSPKSHSGLSV